MVIVEDEDNNQSCLNPYDVVDVQGSIEALTIVNKGDPKLELLKQSILGAL